MPKKLKVEYFVEPDAAALAARAARHFVEGVEQAVAAQGRARIAISGGSTPKAAFALLADSAQPWRTRMPWDRLELYWVDERCVPPDHPDSNYRMTREALLDHVPLAPGQIHRMEGELEPEAAAARYESEIRNRFRLEGAETPRFPTPRTKTSPSTPTSKGRSLGTPGPWGPRFDLIQLGMGPDGHTASLFPHTAALQEMSRLVVANHVENKDAWRITLTWPVINQGGSVFFLIGGADKAQILKEVMTGPRDPERLPSQLIAPAGGILTLILDKAAAGLLPPTDGQGYGFFERDG